MDIYPFIVSALTLLPRIGPAAFALYLYLLGKMDDTGLADPGGVAVMISETGMVDKTLKHAIDVLSAADMLKQTKRFGQSAQFRINLNFVLNTKDNYYNLINICIKDVVEENRKKYEMTKMGEMAELREDGQQLNEAPPLDTPFTRLSDAFSSKTGILFHNPPKWTESVNEMIQAGVEPVDLEAGVDWLKAQKRPYPISGPWSVARSAVIELGKRKGAAEPAQEAPVEIAPIESFMTLDQLEAQGLL